MVAECIGLCDPEITEYEPRRVLTVFVNWRGIILGAVNDMRKNEMTKAWLNKSSLIKKEIIYLWLLSTVKHLQGN